MAVQAVRVILDGVLLAAAVGHALIAQVGPGERRLDAVAGVVGEGERDRARRGDRQQVAVADAVAADLRLELVRQARGAALAVEVAFGVELRKRAFLARQLDRCAVGRELHFARDGRRHLARRLGVVAQTQHDQRVAEAREAEADAPLLAAFLELLRQRPVGGFQHVVEHADGDADGFAERLQQEGGVVRERVRDEARQVDRAEVAAAVRGQRLLAAGVGGGDALAVPEVVVAVDAVDEEDAGLGVVVGGRHDPVPQVPGPHRAVDPESVGAPAGPGRDGVRARLGRVRELDVGVVRDGLHEAVRDGDAHVEIVQLALGVLGRDEVLDVRVCAVQHGHLRAAARAGRFHRRAHGVEYLHVADRARRRALRAAYPRAARPDEREVVADAAAAAHGFRRLVQCDEDAGHAVDVAGNRVRHRLDEAVDQRGLDLGAGRGVDTAAGNEAVGQRPVERRRPAVGVRFHRGEPPRDAPAHVVHRRLRALGVLLEQDVDRTGLRGDQLVDDAAGFGLLGDGDFVGKIHASSILCYRCGDGLPGCPPVQTERVIAGESKHFPTIARRRGRAGSRQSFDTLLRK